MMIYMPNYLFNIGAKALRSTNRWRKSRTPYLDESYVTGLLNDAGIPVTVQSVEPVKDSVAGYKNFYYRIATTGNGDVIYFASMPDRLIEPVERLISFWGGFRYGGPIERKRKDFQDLRFLHEKGVPSVQPVAFDDRTGLAVELYSDGTDLGSFLDSKDYFNDTKLDRCRQGLVIMRQAQELERYSGEAFTENFLVKPSGQVIITDMEKESALNDPISHELAAFVYTASRSMKPREILRLAKELYSVETMRKLPRYSWRMLMFSDLITVLKTVEAVKEVR